MNENLSYSAACLVVIKKFEGLHKLGADGKIKAYRCPAGRWTIGWGHTKAVRSGMSIDEAQAEQFLREDLDNIAVPAIRKLIKVEITQPKMDALCSFIFNVGEANFASSTLLKKINANDFDGAAAEFAKWNKATVDGKKVSLPGLTRRRTAEAALFCMDAPIGDDGVIQAQKVEATAPKPLTQSKTMAGATLAGGAVFLTDAASQVQPYVGYHDYVKYIFLGLSLLGVAIVVYSRWKDRQQGVH